MIVHIEFLNLSTAHLLFSYIFFFFCSFSTLFDYLVLILDFNYYNFSLLFIFSINLSYLFPFSIAVFFTHCKLLTFSHSSTSYMVSHSFLPPKIRGGFLVLKISTKSEVIKNCSEISLRKGEA